MELRRAAGIGRARWRWRSAIRATIRLTNSCSPTSMPARISGPQFVHQLQQPTARSRYRLHLGNRHLWRRQLRSDDRQLNKRFSKGLQFTAAYTYGHALANSGTTLSGSQNLYTKDPTNYATSYADASWDIRTISPPGSTTKFRLDAERNTERILNKFVDALVGGWQTNGIATLHTGNPYTVTSSGCQGVCNGCSPYLVAGDIPTRRLQMGATRMSGSIPPSFVAPAALAQVATLACKPTMPLRPVLSISRSFKSFHHRAI